MTGTDEQVPNRALLKERFERYDKLTAALIRQAEQAETIRRLERLQARLRQGPVRLLVVGVSCSGKSTLINALAGGFVAPEGDYVTSCVPLWVSGREPDPEDDRPRFRALYWGRDHSLHARTNNQADALTKLCHVPGRKAHVPEGLEAMTAQVSGGFLWDSGLTLVDTPGIGQQTADDTQTQNAIDRGAELLLIAHRAPAVSDGNGSDGETSDAAFLQSLFPGGGQDLHLDMKRDLFLLGNNDPGGKGTEAGIRDALKKLVFQWNMFGEKRFYWVNVLRQRQRVGYYHYKYWFPEGADEDTLLGREREDKRAWKRLLEARRIAGSPGGEQAEIEAEEDLITQELLQKAKDEDGRQKLLSRAPARKNRAMKDSRNMEKLRQALTDRALDYYEDPDRLCAPIEEELRQVLREIEEDCRRRVEQKRQEIEEKFAAIPDERISSRRLTELREQDERLSGTMGKLVQALDWLGQEIWRFSQEREQAQKNYQSYEDIGVLIPFPSMTVHILDGEIIEVPTGAKSVRDGTWRQAIVGPLIGEYVRRRSRAQSGLADGTLPLPEGWVSSEHWAQQLEELIQKLNDSLPEEIQRYTLPDPLLRSDPAPFLAAVQKAAQADVSELEKALCQKLTDMQMNWPRSMAGKLTNSVLSLMADGTVSMVKAVVDEGLGQSLCGIGRDIKAYIQFQKECGAKQLEALEKIRQDLRRKKEALFSEYRTNRIEMSQVLAQARGVILRQRLEKELGPLEEELRQWEQLAERDNLLEVSL